MFKGAVILRHTLCQESEGIPQINVYPFLSSRGTRFARWGALASLVRHGERSARPVGHKQPGVRCILTRDSNSQKATWIMTVINTATVLGIDLTTGESRPSACALLDASGALVSVCKLATDEEIMDLVRHRRPAIVAIDSPLGLPKGMDCLEETCGCESVHPFKGRAGERDLLSQGINLYLTTKRSIIKWMVYRAMALAQEMHALGSEVIEVYPFASKVRLFGRPIPPKSTARGRRFLRARMDGLIPGVRVAEQRLDHDHLDALIAAHTAWLYVQGMTEGFGIEEEVRIVVPVAAT